MEPENTAWDIRFQLNDALQSALTDEMVAGATKKCKDAIAELESELECSIKSDLAYNLSSWTYRMAESAVEAILNGDENAMRRYLSCQDGRYNGRDGEHPVIHGKLFETGAIKLRKQVVDAHPELLKNERILDLEDQVKSLVAQVVKLEAEKRELWERYSG